MVPQKQKEKEVWGAPKEQSNDFLLQLLYQKTVVEEKKASVHFLWEKEAQRSCCPVHADVKWVGGWELKPTVASNTKKWLFFPWRTHGFSSSDSISFSKRSERWG